MYIRGVIAAAAAAIGLASSAQAVSYFSLSAKTSDPGLASYESVLTTFDGKNPVGYSDATNFTVAKSADNAPLGDTSKYGSLAAGGSVTFDLRNAFSSRSMAASSISVYLGSIAADDFIQVIGLTDGGSLDLANPLTTISGADLIANFGGTAPDAQRLYINFAPDEQVSALVFGSGKSIFSFDTLATSSAYYAIAADQTVTPDNQLPAMTMGEKSPNQSFYKLSSDGAQVSTSGVPEPANWAMMLGGFLVVGGMLRARRRAAVSFA